MPFEKKSNWTVQEIQSLVLSGETLSSIGKLFNISKQRVKQICNQHNIKSTVIVKQEIKQRKYFDKWGNKTNTDLYNACRTKFNRKKTTAKKNGIEWDIKFGDIIWNESCPILGGKLDYFAETTQENSPSFDRIDPTKGYIVGNVQIVSWRANRIKNDGTAEEHRLIAAYLDSLAA